MVYKLTASKKSSKKQTSYTENPADVIWKELDDVYNEILKLYKKPKKMKSNSSGKSKLFIKLNSQEVNNNGW